MNAKKMFEKINFFIEEDNEEKLVYYCEDMFTDKIAFYKNSKQIICSTPNSDGICRGHQFLNLERLNAINKQVEELGWNNEIFI